MNTVTITLTQEDLDLHPEYAANGWSIGTQIDSTVHISVIPVVGGRPDDRH